ncbi:MULTISPECIES: hypothetical protein, partial [unclassified Microcoleus]|uniref:hypothetical protein n=1 Tax=unclassified Microcoleus TaxID=2642155 RepID=UPI002FD175B8
LAGINFFSISLCYIIPICVLNAQQLSIGIIHKSLIIGVNLRQSLVICGSRLKKKNRRCGQINTD